MFQADLLQDKVVLVTGGGTGLGRAMGERFLELGANITHQPAQVCWSDGRTDEPGSVSDLRTTNDCLATGFAQPTLLPTLVGYTCSNAQRSN
jgi:hypothetical protein